MTRVVLILGVLSVAALSAVRGSPPVEPLPPGRAPRVLAPAPNSSAAPIQPTAALPAAPAPTECAKCCAGKCRDQSMPHCCICPDDYCPKPFPCVFKPACGGADDYCPKPFPCVGKPACGGKDDYCAKPYPCVGLACFPWYSCGVTADCPDCGKRGKWGWLKK